MLEVFLEGELTHVDIKPFLMWMEALELPFDVNRAPHSPKKIFSCYVEASHKQTGIWDLPLPAGHLRLLLSRGKSIGPYNGECIDRKMVAVSEDLSSLNLFALHELGHALGAVDKKRETILRIKTKPEYTIDARNEKNALIDRLSALHPDGLVEFGGFHCLAPNCIMQPVISTTDLLNTKDITELFCADCRKLLYKNKDKLLKEAEEIETCLYCQNIHHCMYMDNEIWEDHPVCKKFSPIAKEDVTE